MRHGLIIDNFAGGGGASTGIELAMGRPIDIAINHDPEAVAMHKMNHPNTKHYCESVWDVNPRELVAGRPVDLVWLSPDCKHFSKAKGGKPVEKNIRGLAWVALRWASLPAPSKPRCIMLENVEEFVTWGPVIVKEDGMAYPDPARRGMTFRSFVNALRRQGYVVEWREMRACDYGAPTSRKRLFLVARCDGQPIVWPAATHGPGRAEPYRTAADIIDWSQPCPSIFSRKRPLKEKTMRRIARGIQRYVFEAAQPFIVPITHTASSDRAHPINEPLRTITTAKGGEFALCVPTIVGAGGPEYSGKPVPCDRPIGTITTENHRQLVMAFLAQHNGGYYDKSGGCGRQLTFPFPTITSRGTQQQLVTSHLIKLRGDNVGSATDEPLHTISAQGTHHGEVRAFLLKYYGTEKDGCDLQEPLHTITSKDRFGLVMVQGQAYQIIDIGMRMLTARELYNANSFPPDYIIDRTENGPLTKVAQVRMCGNSVPPEMAKAVVSANVNTPIWHEYRRAA